MTGIGTPPDWTGGKAPTYADGSPLSAEDARRHRVRKALARGEKLKGPAEAAEAARQKAAEAMAMAEVARQDAEAAQRAAANAARQREARAALERERRGTPIAAQHSSGGPDPFAGDLDHHPEVVALLTSGAPMYEVSAKIAEVKAARDADREAGRQAQRQAQDEAAQRDAALLAAGRSGQKPLAQMIERDLPPGAMWRTRSGALAFDDDRARPRPQTSVIRPSMAPLGAAPPGTAARPTAPPPAHVAGNVWMDEGA
jgi:hypothetical protein